jgi:hypothetical protein
MSRRAVTQGAGGRALSATRWRRRRNKACQYQRVSRTRTMGPSAGRRPPSSITSSAGWCAGSTCRSRLRSRSVRPKPTVQPMQIWSMRASGIPGGFAGTMTSANAIGPRSNTPSAHAGAIMLTARHAVAFPYTQREQEAMFHHTCQHDVDNGGHYDARAATSISGRTTG